MKEENYRMLQTKVSPETYARAKSIERKKGISIYRIIQMMVDTIVRYMDDRHNLTPEIEKAMSLFEHLYGWRDALNLADPTVDKEVGEAIYFLYDPEGKQKGTRAVHVTKPFFGNWTQDENVQHLLERFVCLVFPERYRRLRALAVEEGCSSLLELIDHLIDTHSQDSDTREFREQFEDAARAENNRPVIYGARTKRKHHLTPDSMEARQSIIRFGPDDVPESIDNETY